MRPHGLIQASAQERAILEMIRDHHHEIPFFIWIQLTYFNRYPLNCVIKVLQLTTLPFFLPSRFWLDARQSSKNWYNVSGVCKDSRSSVMIKNSLSNYEQSVSIQSAFIRTRTRFQLWYQILFHETPVFYCTTDENYWSSATFHKWWTRNQREHARKWTKLRTKLNKGRC